MVHYGKIIAIDQEPRSIRGTGIAVMWKVRILDLTSEDIYLHWAIGRASQACWLRQGDIVEFTKKEKESFIFHGALGKIPVKDVSVNNVRILV